MRNVVAGLFISLDGVTESPNRWQFDNFDEELGAATGEMMTGTETFLLGRVTYEDWNTYWPTSNDEPFASFINNIPKIVVSKTLKDVSWGGFDTVSLLEGDLSQEIGALKAQPGGTITVTGSPGLVRSLLQGGLLDELQLMIHPVVAGRGKRLFGEGEPQRLTLATSKTTRTGVVIATYKPRRA